MGNAPCVGLNPTAPQYAAGRSSDPWVCVPSATGSMPAPTAAPEPLEEPPGVRSLSCGLRVTFVAPHAKEVVTVLPTITAPPLRNACTHAASYAGCHPLKAGLPISVGRSAVSMMSLIPTGQPSTIDSGLPAR